jgi:hypothetical protein
MVLFKSRGFAGLKEETRARSRSGLLARRAKGSWEVDEEGLLSAGTELDGWDAIKTDLDVDEVGSLGQVRAWTASR